MGFLKKFTKAATKIGGTIGGVAYRAGKNIGTKVINEVSEGALEAVEDLKFKKYRDRPLLDICELAAYIIAIDGKVLNQEINHVELKLKKLLNEQANEYINFFRKLLQNHSDGNISIDITTTFAYNKKNLYNETRIQYICFLFEIASADSIISEEEFKFIKEYSNEMDITPDVFKACFNDYKKYYTKGDSTEDNNSLKNALDSLGLDINATFSDINRQFKKLAKLYHPDKNPEINDHLRKLTEERFIKIKESYEYLKKSKKYNQEKSSEDTLLEEKDTRQLQDWIHQKIMEYGVTKLYMKSKQGTMIYNNKIKYLDDNILIENHNFLPGGLALGNIYTIPIKDIKKVYFDKINIIAEFIVEAHGEKIQQQGTTGDISNPNGSKSPIHFVSSITINLSPNLINDNHSDNFILAFERLKKLYN